MVELYICPVYLFNHGRDYEYGYELDGWFPESYVFNFRSTEPVLDCVVYETTKEDEFNLKNDHDYMSKKPTDSRFFKFNSRSEMCESCTKVKIVVTSVSRCPVINWKKLPNVNEIKFFSKGGISAKHDSRIISDVLKNIPEHVKTLIFDCFKVQRQLNFDIPDHIEILNLENSVFKSPCPFDLIYEKIPLKLKKLNIQSHDLSCLEINKIFDNLPPLLESVVFNSTTKISEFTERFIEEMHTFARSPSLKNVYIGERKIDF